MIGKLKCLFDRHNLAVTWSAPFGSRAADCLMCTRCKAVRYQVRPNVTVVRKKR